MLGQLVGFLLICLIVIVVIYGLKIVLDWLELPPPVKSIALTVVSVIALIILLVKVLAILGVPVAF